MAKVFQTSNREGAARALLDQYPRVLVRNKNVLWNPLRLRRAKLADLNPYIVLNPVQFDAHLDAWNRDGGMLIYDRSFTAHENVGPHEAQLISECPLSLTMLDNYVEGTSEVAVIYRPPSWDEHHRWIHNNRPSADLCQKLYALIEAAAGHASLGDAFELRPGFHVLSEQWAETTLDIPHARLCCIRNAVFPPRAFKEVRQILPRIEPEDATLLSAYEAILECPAVGGVHFVRKGAVRPVALRALNRCGSIGMKDTLYYYYLDQVTVHWERLDARRRVAEGRLGQMIRCVEEASEFNLPPASHSPQSSFLPRRAPLSSSA